MQHQQVIQQFIEGRGGRGTYVKADGDVLSSQFPQEYRPWGRWGWRSLSGRSFPLAVRLGDGNLLVNGARLDWPATGHQQDVLRALQDTPRKFGVVPFHSIAAAWTDGEVRDWNQKPIPTKDLQREVGIVVPSAGERWPRRTSMAVCTSGRSIPWETAEYGCMTGTSFLPWMRPARATACISLRSS